jgi:hypothetical protein
MASQRRQFTVTRERQLSGDQFELPNDPSWPGAACWGSMTAELLLGTAIDPLATFASGSFRATKITLAGHHQKGHRFDLFVFRP